jgi:Zn-dependent protease with chaperone function
MYETQSLLAAFVIVSTLTSLTAIGLVRRAQLGSPRTRSFVLLVALAMAFSVFWAPFSVTSPSENSGASDGPILDSAHGGRSVLIDPASGAISARTIASGANVSVSNGTSDSSYAVREPANFPPARLIDGRGPPRTYETREAVLTAPVPESSGMDAAQLRAVSGIAAGQFRSSTGAAVGVQQDAGWFWTLSAVLLLAAAAYLAIQLASGKRRLLTRLGARPCLDPEILELVGRTAKKMGVRSPRVYICDGPANAFVFGYPATLVISSRLLRRLTGAELELCIRHELAHVRNGDLLVKPLLQSIRILFVYNPGVHLLVRRMLKERELAADRLFIKSRNDRIDFMSALATLHLHEPKQVEPAHAHDAQAPKQTEPAPRIPYGASALGAHRAGGHLEERFDNLFKEQEPRPLRAFSLCALIVFANLSLLGVPATVLGNSGGLDPQGETGFFPPVHGHFMSWRAAAEAGHPPPMNDTTAEAGHSPPGNATSEKPGHYSVDIDSRLVRVTSVKHRSGAN